jgi:hypothetical protein
MWSFHLQKTLSTYSFRATLGSVQAWILQEADWAFFKVFICFLGTRVTGSKLGLKYKATKLLLIHITTRV